MSVRNRIVTWDRDRPDGIVSEEGGLQDVPVCYGAFNGAQQISKRSATFNDLDSL